MHFAADDVDTLIQHCMGREMTDEEALQNGTNL